MNPEPRGTAWDALGPWPALQRALEVAGAGRHTLRVVGPRTCNVDQAQSCAVTLGAQSCLWVEPCGCGYLGDHRQECTCTPRLVERLQRRLRRGCFDLTVEVATPSAGDYRSPSEPFAEVLARAAAARERRESIPLALAGTAETLMHAATERLGLSPDARRRILDVARTIQSLSRDHERIGASALAEAVQYCGEHKFGRRGL
jgi:predicted ATPase with chaperone activity